MRIENRSRVIPETTYEYDVYIASDGREFLGKEACEDYETRLKLEEKIVFKTCIKGIYTLDDEYAILYNIENDEDHGIILSQFRKHELEYLVDDYSKFGPGWYIYYSSDGGDGPDFHYIRNYEAYVKELEDELDNWKAEISSKMSTV